MYTAIAIIIVIASILLTLVVLVQNSKGGGLAANFAAGNQTFGVRQTADFLEKATWTLAIFIVVCSIISSFFINDTLVQGSRIVQQPVQQEQSTPFATEQAPVAADSVK